MTWTAEDRREYFHKRQRDCRVRLIEMFGGCCIRCGSTDDLQFDHIDASTREFRLSGWGFNYSWERVLKEAAKCQLLCGPCHKDKSRECGEVGGGQHRRIPDDQQQHGTARMYVDRKCRCVPCGTAYRLYKKGLIRRDEQVEGM